MLIGAPDIQNLKGMQSTAEPLKNDDSHLGKFLDTFLATEEHLSGGFSGSMQQDDGGGLAPPSEEEVSDSTRAAESNSETEHRVETRRVPPDSGLSQVDLPRTKRDASLRPDSAEPNMVDEKAQTLAIIVESPNQDAEPGEKPDKTPFKLSEMDPFQTGPVRLEHLEEKLVPLPTRRNGPSIDHPDSGHVGALRETADSFVVPKSADLGIETNNIIGLRKQTHTIPILSKQPPVPQIVPITDDIAADVSKSRTHELPLTRSGEGAPKTVPAANASRNVSTPTKFEPINPDNSGRRQTIDPKEARAPTAASVHSMTTGVMIDNRTGVLVAAEGRAKTGHHSKTPEPTTPPRLFSSPAALDLESVRPNKQSRQTDERTPTSLTRESGHAQTKPAGIIRHIPEQKADFRPVNTMHVDSDRIQRPMKKITPDSVETPLLPPRTRDTQPRKTAPLSVNKRISDLDGTARKSAPQAPQGTEIGVSNSPETPRQTIGVEIGGTDSASYRKLTRREVVIKNAPNQRVGSEIVERAAPMSKPLQELPEPQGDSEYHIHTKKGLISRARVAVPAEKRVVEPGQVQSAEHVAKITRLRTQVEQPGRGSPEVLRVPQRSEASAEIAPGPVERRSQVSTAPHSKQNLTSGNALTDQKEVFSLQVQGDVSDPVAGFKPALLPESDQLQTKPVAGRLVADPLPVLKQIAPALLNQTDGLVEISLDPEELGRVRMKMSMSEQGIVITMQAERSETLDLLKRNIDQLARDLSDAGYDNASFMFGSDDRGQSSGNSETKNHGLTAENQDSEDRNNAPADGLDIRI